MAGLLQLALVLQLLRLCQAQSGSIDTDTTALLDFKISLGNPESLSSWVPDQNPCTSSWLGVNCTSGRVTSLELQALGLRGTLSQALSGMSELKTLDLSRNLLNGALPESWSFPSLQTLNLADNELTSTLQPAWGSGLPGLQLLSVQGNKLAGTLPSAWTTNAAFSTPFVGTLQFGNSDLCGPFDLAPSQSLLHVTTDGQQWNIKTTLGSCAQGSCGNAALNSTAPNLYDVSWANTASPLDVAAFNNNIELTTVPMVGTPVQLPCYPYAAPSWFGSNVVYKKATWQSSTDGTQTSDLAVAGQGLPASTTQCSVTTDSPSWWMVDMQQSAVVQAVLLYAGANMQQVEVRVGDDTDPTANALCTSNKNLETRQGFIAVCDNLVQGRYLSVLATQSRLSLCRVEAYSLATNAALGKYTAASNGNAAAVTDGSVSKCTSTVVSGADLTTWITVDLGYSAEVSTAVIANGASEFAGDLTVRLGDEVVKNGDENLPCATGLTLQNFSTLPVQCLGTGRFLTLWVRRPQASTMYICELYVYLKNGPTQFGGPSPYRPPPSPPPQSPSISPSPVGPIDPSITSETTLLDVILVMVGSDLSPMSLATQQAIATALTSVWAPANGITEVSFINYVTVDPTTVRAQLYVRTPEGQAPTAAVHILQSTASGQVSAALSNEGVSTSSVTAESVTAYTPSPPPSPSPAPGPDTNSGSSVPVGAIVGGVVGGVAALAAAFGVFVYLRRARRREPSTPKLLASMEQGRLGPLGKKDAGGKLLIADAASLTQGPNEEVLSFLYQDPQEAAAHAGNSQGMIIAADSSSSLQKQKSLAHVSGVSELWLVDYQELEVLKQIGEGSFGKVHLAKWRETTVAVKVLSSTGVSSSLEEEFPDGSPTARDHPLFESLQKEAAMMASLRHPSIVMYLGVCLDPPAVVTEYCARGSLNDVLKRARSAPALAAQLDWPRRLNMALDAAKGMLYLHSCSPPIVHRDLKSPNLLVDKHWRVKVCDFNLSRVMESSVVLSSVAATNPRWLAPEILSGKGYTYSSDVYAFGIILWEFLTWQVPWHECGPWQVVAMVTESSKRPEVPEEQQLPSPPFAGQAEYLELMRECWAQDPLQRPSFAAVISRLRKMLALEAQRQRSQRGCDSPTKSPKAGIDGADTPHASSRPIVSIYELSNNTDAPSSRAEANFAQKGSEDLLGSRITESGLLGSMSMPANSEALEHNEDDEGQPLTDNTQAGTSGGAD